MDCNRVLLAVDGPVLLLQNICHPKHVDGGVLTPPSQGIVAHVHVWCGARVVGGSCDVRQQERSVMDDGRTDRSAHRERAPTRVAHDCKTLNTYSVIR